MPDQLFSPYERGRALMDIGRFSEAIAEFTERLAARPEDGYLLLLIGQCHYELSDLYAAEKHLEASVGANPDDPYAHHVLGMTLLAREETERAKACLDAALALAPEDKFFLLGQAKYAIVVRDYRAGEQFTDRALATDPAFLNALQIKAFLLSLRGKADAAAKVVQEALRLDPVNPETLNVAAGISDSRGDLEAAALFQKQSLRLAPGRDRAQDYLQAKAKADTRLTVTPVGSWKTMVMGLLALVPINLLSATFSSFWFDGLVIAVCALVVVLTLLPFVHIAITSKKAFGQIMVFQDVHQARSLIHTVGAAVCLALYFYTRRDVFFSATLFMLVYGLIGLALQVTPKSWLTRIGYALTAVAYVLGIVNFILDFTPLGSVRLIGQVLFVGSMVLVVVMGLALNVLSEKEKHNT